MRENQQKYQQRSKLERKTATRKSRDTVLIVCEGECTEPNYLKGLLFFLKIPAPSVKITGKQKNHNATAVVREAKICFKESYWDHVFVVIDGEQEDIEVAAKECKKPIEGTEVKIQLICSKPCFEFWLLLHFQYSDQAFTKCKSVISCLGKKYLPNYKKNDLYIFQKVSGKDQKGLDRAIQHTKQLRKFLKDTHSDLPSTDMDKLAAVLFSMQKEK